MVILQEITFLEEYPQNYKKSVHFFTILDPKVTQNWKWMQFSAF